MEYFEDMESLNDFQYMDEYNFTNDQILKHLEELIVEAIVGALHCEMMVMLGPQHIISPNE